MHITHTQIQIHFLFSGRDAFYPFIVLFVNLMQHLWNHAKWSPHISYCYYIVFKLISGWCVGALYTSSQSQWERIEAYEGSPTLLGSNLKRLLMLLQYLYIKTLANLSAKLHGAKPWRDNIQFASLGTTPYILQFILYS